MDVLGFEVPLPTWAVLLIATLTLLVIHYKIAYGVFAGLGIPHPRPWPYVGNALFSIQHGYIRATLKGYRAFKSKGLYGVYEGRTPVLTVTDLDMLQQIMIKQFNAFTDRKRYAAMNQKGVDGIMFNTVGADWRGYRNLLRPQLAPARLKAVSHRVEKLCKRMVDTLTEHVRCIEVVDVYEILGCFCMDAIADLGFDVDCDSVRNPNHQFVTTCRRVLDVFGERLFCFEFFAPPLLKQVMDYFGVMILPKREINFLREFTRKAMETRRSRPRDQNPDDFLQYMLDRSDDNLAGSKRTFTEEEIYASTITYFLAGYDTSAKGLAFSMYNLAMNPKHFKKAQREVDQVLKGEFPGMNNVGKLKYIDCCINESNRLYPLGIFVERQCLQDITIKGQFIPKGMNIRIPIIGIHHDPDIYPNPKAYDPDRFQPEAIEKRHPMAFLPFGAGPRACFGQPLAMMLMRIGMAGLMQAFDMEPCTKSEYPIRISPLSDLIPEHGLWLRLIPRKGDNSPTPSTNQPVT